MDDVIDDLMKLVWGNRDVDVEFMQDVMLKRILRTLFKKYLRIPKQDEPSFVTRPEPNTLIDHDKYTFEEHHEVKTKDGYLLKLHRIKKIYTNPDHAALKDAVFLQHDFMDSSITWFMNKNGLAFTLADAGYDVWLGNNRGNFYSNKHILDGGKNGPYRNTEDYWKFTWDDMASKDLPAMIDYVLDRTQKPNLYYVGHSQGGLIGFVELSRNPKLASQVKHFFALAPAVYLGNMTSTTRLLIDVKEYLLRIFYLLITLSFLPWELPSKILTNIIPYPMYAKLKRTDNFESKTIWNFLIHSLIKIIYTIIRFIWSPARVCALLLISLFNLICLPLVPTDFIIVLKIAKDIIENSILYYTMIFWEALLGRKGMNKNVDIFSRIFIFQDLKNAINAANKRETIKFICGESDESLSETELNHCLQFYPSDSSVKNSLHLIQLIRSGRPESFDYGLEMRNYSEYDQVVPIPLNVQNIAPEKCTIFFGQNDSLVPANDIVRNLGRCTNDLNLIYGFNHVDFVWAPAAKDKVYKKILRKIKDFDELANRNI